MTYVKMLRQAAACGAVWATGLVGWGSPEAKAEWPFDTAPTAELQLCSAWEDMLAGTGDASDWLSRPRLGGDLGGLRPAAAERGIDGRIDVTQFYQGTASGGQRQSFEYAGRNDYWIDVDGQKLGLGPGLFINLHGETRYGEDLTNETGALLPANIGMVLPAPGQTISALTGFKVTQALSEEFVVFGGKLNALDGYVLNYGSGRGVERFQHSALVFSPILARTVPYSTFGVGAAVLRDLHPVLSVVVMDAVDRSTEWAIGDAYSQGAVILAEYRQPVAIGNLPGHQIVGATWSSRKYTALSDTPYLLAPPEFGLIPGQETGSWAVYYNMDQTLWVNPNDPQKTFGVFAQTGIADDATNFFRWALSLGVSGQIPWDFRPQDEFGLGYFYLGTSSDLSASLAGLLPVGDGQGGEVYYKANLTPWFALTFNVQALQQSLQTIDNAVVVGLRAKVTF